MMSNLLNAIQQGDLASVATYLKAGEDPNSCTRLGLSALHVAAIRNEVITQKY